MLKQVYIPLHDYEVNLVAQEVQRYHDFDDVMEGREVVDVNLGQGQADTYPAEMVYDEPQLLWPVVEWKDIPKLAYKKPVFGRGASDIEESVSPTDEMAFHKLSGD